MDESHPDVIGISARERMWIVDAVITYLARGGTQRKDIAAHLGINERTLRRRLNGDGPPLSPVECDAIAELAGIPRTVMLLGWDAADPARLLRGLSDAERRQLVHALARIAADTVAGQPGPD